jgi:outer membrane protein OmpA-like peptidoglycan-associated protein
MPQAPQTGPSFTDVDCELEALPRTGNVVGTVKDGGGGNVGGAVITITDALGKDQKVTADGSGAFKAEGLPPGEITLLVEAPGFMRHVATGDVRANEDAKTTLTLNKRPKNALVKIQGNELKLSDKILFETDSAKILGQSSALLEEVAEVLQKNPNIQQVEIQGHTDNSGGRDHNQKLSDSRASSVRDWLVKAGVQGSRLTAKGYGQDRPLAPNVTEANKAKNRRVQFIILKK